MPKKLAPVHPGEILRTEFLEPLNLSQHKLSLELHVPATRINDIVKGERSISAETAIRLGLYFGTSPQFWMNLQSQYDLAVAEDAALKNIKREIRPLAHA